MASWRLTLTRAATTVVAPELRLGVAEHGAVVLPSICEGTRLYVLCQTANRGFDPHREYRFSQGFALWLEDQTGFQANLVDRVTQIRPGEIYVAPGGEQNMIFTSAGAVRLEPSAKDEIHVPNIDALLNSLARYQAAATCSVVLTGMGRDGAKGSLAIHQGGGTALAQAPETATIASMPQAVLDEGASVRGLPIPTLSAYLNTWARHMSR